MTEINHKEYKRELTSELDIEKEVVAYGKIPRRSIQIPTIVKEVF